VPVVTVGRPKVAPRESENEVPAVAAAEGVGKTEVSGIKVVSEGMVLARV
jgi:hypothetical protein